MSYVSTVLADSPLFLLRCQESSGQLVDSADSHNTVTIVGTPTYNQSGGVSSDSSSRSVLFTAANPDYFEIGYSASLDIGDVGSCECLIKRADASTAEMALIAKDQGFFLGLTNNRILIAQSSVAEIARSTATITDTTSWHHIVITKSAGTVKQYLDGSDVTGTVTNSTWGNGASPLTTIGDEAGNPYNGNASEFAVYNYALTAAQVLAHYNALTGAASPGGKSSMLLLGVG